jgi:molybdopterin synthase catalytic subunit
MTNRINILFFANLKDLTGVHELILDIPDGTTVLEFKALLVGVHPEIQKHIDSTVVSINQNFAFDNDEIPRGAEIALFPPVSGGADNSIRFHLAITEEEIDIDSLIQAISSPITGAVVIFNGLVRGHTTRDQPRDTDYLVYDSYVPMAELKMRQVADEIHDRWPEIVGVAIVQRVGNLGRGSSTVVIACSAAHRDSGVFEAARYGIDRVKEIVPIWKKEVGPSGENWVSGEYIPSPKDK